jgi:methionyl-tRNA formyltransferase
MEQNPTFAFFGTGALAESVLSALVQAGYMPTLVVTKPDSIQGRHMQLVEPYIKTWANLKGIEVYQPESLKDVLVDSPLHIKNFDVFIVASYGKIIPDSILRLASHGALNVHPSLLPKFRGPSPIESALLSGDMTTGVTIIRLDAEMDHGPMLVQSAMTISPYANAGTLEVTAGQLGGELLVSVLPHYLEGTITLKDQDHQSASICRKISKDMGLVHLTDDIDIVRRKFRAFTPWPTLYFFIVHNEKEIRIKINDIELIEDKESRELKDYILEVTPEGKKLMDFESFCRGYL